MIAVSLGGEGEPVPGASFVVHANLFEASGMRRPDFATGLDSGHVAVRMSAGATALRDGCVDLVVARNFPIQFDRTIDGFGVRDIASEAFRVAKTGAMIDFACSSCDVDELRRAIGQAGFIGLEVHRHRYAVRGRKP